MQILGAKDVHILPSLSNITWSIRNREEKKSLLEINQILEKKMDSPQGPTDKKKGNGFGNKKKMTHGGQEMFENKCKFQREENINKEKNICNYIFLAFVKELKTKKK